MPGGRTWVCRSLKLHPDSYKHPRYGKIFVPVLHVVNWTGADGKPLSLKDDLSDDLSDDLKAALFL
jgi:hypothetical protein